MFMFFFKDTIELMYQTGIILISLAVKHGRATVIVWVETYVKKSICKVQLAIKPIEIPKCCNTIQVHKFK